MTGQMQEQDLRGWPEEEAGDEDGPNEEEELVHVGAREAALDQAEAEAGARLRSPSRRSCPASRPRLPLDFQLPGSALGKKDSEEAKIGFRLGFGQGFRAKNSDGGRGASSEEEEGEEVAAQGPGTHSGNTAGFSSESSVTSRAILIGNSRFPLERPTAEAAVCLRNRCSGVGDGVEKCHEDTMLPLTWIAAAAHEEDKLHRMRRRIHDIPAAEGNGFIAASHLRPCVTSPPLTFPSFPGHICTGTFQTLN
jgi:hypothetical protein